MTRRTGFRDWPPKSDPISTRHALPSCRHGKSFSDSTTASARVDQQHCLAGSDRQSLADLARHEVRDLHRGPDELEVPASRFGHATQQRFVEVGAHAERGGDHAPVPPHRRAAHDLVVVRHARVREAVGQEQAAAHLLDRQVLDHLLATPAPSALEVGLAPRPDAGHALRSRLPCRGRGLRRGNDRVDPIVVGDDGEPVIVAQRADPLQDRLAGVPDLVAVHRAGAVEDEGEVDGKAAGPQRSLGRQDLGAHEAVAPGPDPDQLAVGTDGESHVPSCSRDV